MLDEEAYAIEGSDPGGLGECARLEGDRQIFEQDRSSAHAEVMTDESQVRQVLLVKMRHELVATWICQPKAEESTAVRQHQAADRSNCLGS